MSWVNPQTANYALQASDNNKLVVFNSSSAITCTLPQPFATVNNEWLDSTFRCMISSIGVGTLTVTPTVATIDGQTSVTVTQYQGMILCCDGTNYFTVRGT
jgi:hypothetical protein